MQQLPFSVQFKIMSNATSKAEMLTLFAKPLNWLLTGVSLYLNHVIVLYRGQRM